MRKIAAFSLPLALLLASSTQALYAQTRARRVEDGAAKPASPPAKPPGGNASNAADKEVREEIGDDEIVRVDTTLITLPVSVMDRSGRYISDLRREDFRIFEDGVEQDVTYFAEVEKPFTVVLMLDTSSSIWSKLGKIKEAAIAFAEQLRPDDRVMVVTFAGGLTVMCEPTSDRQAVRKAIERTGRGLSTHLYDAVEKVIKKHLARISGRKAVVLFTDGVDASSSHASYESNVRDAEELDALVYPILYDTYDGGGYGSTPPHQPRSSRLPSILRRLPLPFPVPVTIGSGGGGSSGGGASRADYERGRDYLHDMAEKTGGRVYEANRDLSYLRQAFANIAEELRRQYSLGYYPKMQSAGGGRRRIRVRVERPDLAVRARDSYVYKPSTAAAADNAKPPTSAQDGQKQPTPPVLKKKPFVAKR